MPEEISLDNLIITPDDELADPKEIGKVKKTAAIEEYANTINNTIDDRLRADPNLKGHLDEAASAEYTDSGLVQAAKTIEAQERDSQTGLLNKRAFYTRIYEELNRLGRRESGVLEALTIDLNGFKEINDTLGHKVGDELIVKCAEDLSKVVRPYDIVSRLGGDEFGILLADGKNDLAEEVAVRIQEQLNKVKAQINGTFNLSASIGAASVKNNESNILPEDFLHRSDVAMYNAKRDKIPFVRWKKEMGIPQKILNNR